MDNRVAVVGMACRYPDAASPVELWENVLAGRRAFRRIPRERLRIEDYYSTDPADLDSIYTTEACLIEGYEFNRVKYRVSASTYRGADHAHWLALDVAAAALEDAGFPQGEGLPRETTGVLVGNTLTGEFSRANTLRLRWPYVRRVLNPMLSELDWTAAKRAEFLRECERRFKEPFAQMNEETLAGNLSNTIAGRICNHFDLNGAGYTLDAACASSLLAIATSCSALIAGDIDLALAGGVDLSLDPFELVGFARAGALAHGPMRVYDERSSGFLPGEGCGFVVLMRHRDALGQGRRIYGVVQGWGVSSDGAGGITRPESAGQLLALKRAYKRAGVGIESVAYFEGHGTGTSVGDATELRALSEARRSADAEYPAAIGSIKANIGHTKAAAGVAGFIKAVMAVHRQTIPPTTACDSPHRELKGANASLRVPTEGEPWPGHVPIRAGVSAMGFGGINTHVVIEAADPKPRGPFSALERAMLSSCQDAEVFLLSSDSAQEMSETVSRLLEFAGRLSLAELGDLAAHLALDASHAASSGAIRAAIVASKPSELQQRLAALLLRLEQGVTRSIEPGAGVFIGTGPRGRTALLFPGQASPVYVDGGAFARRFSLVKQLYSRADLPLESSHSDTELAQPAIITASIAALQLLEQCGIEAEVAIGHSVGEIAALHWAGAIDQDAAIRIASARGRAMACVPAPHGKMVSIKAPRSEVERLVKGFSLVIACINSSDQTVVSGLAEEVEALARLAGREGLPSVVLPVSHAFHSPLVAPAIPGFRAHLSSELLKPLRRTVISTVTGAKVAADEDLVQLLSDQIVSPVLFADALAQMPAGIDLFIEAGPGSVLSGIVEESLTSPVISIDSGGSSLEGLLKAVAAAHSLGTPINTAALFGDRFTRPFNLDWNPRFLANPCESAPLFDDDASLVVSTVREPNLQLDDTDCCATGESEECEPDSCDTRESVLDLVKALVAARTDLPADAIQPNYRLLGDLHLNSITVSQIVAEAARRLTLAPPIAPADYSVVSIAEVAAALEELRPGGRPAAKRKLVSGVDSWVRCFTVAWQERAPRQRPLGEGRSRRSGACKWEVVSRSDSSLGETLRHGLTDIGGGGVAVVLEDDSAETNAALLLQAAQAALSNKDADRFLLVQHQPFGAAFVRTLQLEAPWLTCCVVQIPPNQPKAVEWISAEAATAVGFTEAEYDASGVRRVPVLQLLQRNEPREPSLQSPDVVLVSGGGKGIVAECALALARQSGASLAIVGRSSPELDPELAANLARLTSHGIAFRYYVGDVIDRMAILEIARRASHELGPITAIIHGAGLNEPKLIESLTPAECLDTIRPKVDGARNLLDSVDQARLRLFVTFGSLIARTGMRGEAHYALANELLRTLTQDWQLGHPHCRAICIEWSVWAGPGMGQRLGALDALVQEGITPISLEQGIDSLSRLIFESPADGPVVVTGRFGQPQTVTMQEPELPLRRFLEHPRIHYPGVELIVEDEISWLSDPYVADHIFDGDALFPAVMGLEAMAQTAMALAQEDKAPAFEDVEFNRAIVVPREGFARIRIAALAREDRAIEVVIRSEDTDYQVNHFRAVCKFESAKTIGAFEAQSFCPEPQRAGDREPIDLDPARDLYGRLLFHTGRFVRINKYYRITAMQCTAEIGESETAWFGPYLPRGLELGCPGRRDAAIHAIQVCVPDSALLPVGAGRIRIYGTERAGPTRVIATERERIGDVFVYDVIITAEDGDVLEIWERLKLRRARTARLDGGWPLPLVSPYLERLLTDTAGASVSVVFKKDPGERRARSDSAIQLASGNRDRVVRRLDGKPEIIGGRAVSASHSGDLTMAVAGASPLACDVESVESRHADVWRDLLGDEGLALAQVASRMAADDLDTAATRVWAAKECLRKCGAPAQPSLTLSGQSGNCVVFLSGSLSVITVCLTVAPGSGRTVLAVLSGRDCGQLADRSATPYQTGSAALAGLALGTAPQ